MRRAASSAYLLCVVIANTMLFSSSSEEIETQKCQETTRLQNQPLHSEHCIGFPGSLHNIAPCRRLGLHDPMGMGMGKIQIPMDAGEPPSFLRRVNLVRTAHRSRHPAFDCITPGSTIWMMLLPAVIGAMLSQSGASVTFRPVLRHCPDCCSHLHCLSPTARSSTCVAHEVLDRLATRSLSH